MTTAAPFKFSELVRDPSTIRDSAVKVAYHLGEENTYLELLRFLPTSTIAEFIDHLQDVADIDDLI